MTQAANNTQFDICSQSEDELLTLVAALGEPDFRAKQIFSWIHRGYRPEEMSNLSKSLREKLSAMPFGGARIIETRTSKVDDTKKFLFELDDGELVEGVLMSYNYGRTLCISSQVGCLMGCAFCASTLNGCVRSLSAGEMLSEVTAVERAIEKPDSAVRTVTNIVMMGSGEPLQNYDSTVKFLQLVSAPNGINISPRNISLSTCGIVENMGRLIDDAPHVTLSISLHAPNDAIRSSIMPINKKYGINSVLFAAKEYERRTGRRVIFEYALIDGVNNLPEHASELAYRLRGINCHVNLIPLNPVKERDLAGVTRAQAEDFAAQLTNLHVSATIRREMGRDIEGACGQLRRRYIEGVK